jgi:hypothetical protein
MEPDDMVRLALDPRASREGGYSMAITSFTRFKSDKTEEMVKAAKQAKKLVEKHGAEFLRLSRFHTGSWVGEWLVVTRYSSWEVFGKAQEGLAKDPAWAKLIAHTAGIAQITGRSIAVGVDL